MRSTLGYRWVGIVGVVLLVSGRARGAPPQMAPWLSLENADKYVFVGKSVWDVETGKQISPTGAPDVFETTRRIVGVTDRVYDLPPGGYHPAGMGVPGRIVMLDGSLPQTPALDGKMEQDQGNGPAFWASTDHRRVIWIERGDFWRGEIDWATSKIVNRKQVTTVGSFNPLNKPLLWWGQLLFIWGNFDKEKPIVRLDLATGEMTEMETYRTFQVLQDPQAVATKVSPGVCRIVSPTPSLISSYDVRTGRASMFRNKYETLAPGRGRQDVLFGAPNAVWVDDETVYSFDPFGWIARLDLRSARMEIVHKPAIAAYADPAAFTKLVGMVPGTHLADVATGSGGGKESGPIIGKRYLMDVTTGERTPLPFDETAMGVWVDSTIYIYVQTKGGLSGVGTWAYDRASNKSTRLIGVQCDLMRLLYLPKRKEVWAASQQSGVNLIRLKLDGTPSQNLGSCPLSGPQRLPPAETAIDLGFGGSKKDLWEPVKVDEAALAATRPAEPPAGKLKLFELTKDGSADDKKFAELAYDYCSMNATLNAYTDPVKFAMKVLGMHRGEPNSPVQNLIFNKDFSDCLDRDRLLLHGHDQAMGMMRSDTKLTPETKEKIADRTGQLLADLVAKQAKKDVRNLESLIRDAYTQARKEVTGEAVTGSQVTGPATPGRGGQQQADSQQNQQQGQQQQQNPQQQQSQKKKQQQQQSSEADKAANEAQKAKDTANRLRGIFRH
jgi:hypothetical protein